MTDEITVVVERVEVPDVNVTVEAVAVPAITVSVEPFPAGADGADGAPGPAGPQGPQGPAGVIGADGVPVLVGEGDPADLGLPGQGYVNADNGDVWLWTD